MTPSLPRLHECPACEARADLIEVIDRSWHCHGCSTTWELAPDGRLVRRLPAARRTDVSGHLIDGE